MKSNKKGTKAVTTPKNRNRFSLHSTTKGMIISINFEGIFEYDDAVATTLASNNS